MSPAVIYHTSSPWTPPRSPPASPIRSHKCVLSPQPSEQGSKTALRGSSTFELPPGVPNHTRSFSMLPFMPHNSGVNGIGNPQYIATANSPVGMYSSTLGGHVHSTNGSVDPSCATHQNLLTTGPGHDLSTQSVHALGNSRSARMRRALSVPTRSVSTTMAGLPIADVLPSLPRLQSRPVEVIAEFGPRDQLVSYPFSTPRASYESPGILTPYGIAALPPRLQATSPPLGKSRFKSWRPTDEELPPRFRGSQPSAPRVLSPPASLRDQTPATRKSSPLNHLAVSFQPQLSQPQHLSSFLSNNVSYTNGIPGNGLPIQQPDLKPLELSSKARALAPIGAERAQRLASTANVIPSNYRYNSDNLKSHSILQDSTNIGPPSGFAKSLSLPSISVAHEPHSQLSQGLYPNFPGDPSLPLDHIKSYTHMESLTELEKLFLRMKTNKYAPRIFSPLSPLRHPDSWAPSDGKWRREEREQRRQRTLYSCETSVFRRRISDQRSRIECEEFAYGLEESEHCFWCRQDTLCKRLLVHRAREAIRSNSSSPLSDFSTSSDEGISDDDPILDTPVDSTPRIPVTSTSEKLMEFRLIEVVDTDDEEHMAPDSPPSIASRTRASPALVHMDI